MKIGNKHPKTLMEAVNYFADLDVAHEFFVQIRWPDGVVCPQCGSRDAKYLPKYRRFQCNHSHSRRQFTVKTGSVMEDSPLSLDKWAVAFWLEANAKNSISSYEIHRSLGITQKSAWFMLHRIRLAMKNDKAPKLTGVVEADETYIGGKFSNMHAKKRKRFTSTYSGGKGGLQNTGKAIVVGVLARGGEVRTQMVNAVGKQDLHPVIHKHVEPGATIYTDSHRAYRSLRPEYTHDFIDHEVQYVRGNVHTNSLENFWSLFKRCIKGTHVSIEPAHLEAYLDAEMFRFNKRNLTDGERLIAATVGYTGKRLTYKALIGALGSAPGILDTGAGNGSLPA